MPERTPLRTWRVAIPKRSLSVKPIVGARFEIRTTQGTTVSDVIEAAALHHTKVRHIGRAECIQTAWRDYDGAYWLLTLRAPKRKAVRRAITS